MTGPREAAMLVDAGLYEYVGPPVPPGFPQRIRRRLWTFPGKAARAAEVKRRRAAGEAPWDRGWIQEKRRELWMTRERLAILTGIPLASLRSIELGQDKRTTRDRMRKIERALR